MPVRPASERALKRCAFAGYGLTLELSAEARLVRRVSSTVPPGFRRVARPAAATPAADLVLSVGREGDEHVLRRRGRTVARGTPSALCDRLRGELERWVALAARDHLFVHAGVVGWRGRAIVVPGRSLAGKSTLVDALVRAGATYYSDEYAAIDERGWVHPFARAIGLRGESGPRRVRPRRVGRRALPVGLVLLCRYREGAEFRPRPLSASRAVLGLFKHTVAARVRAVDGLTRLACVTRGAQVLHGPRGEARAAARALLAMVE
ncbi:MAG: hypothetical protein JWN44_6855 [Myxococcales bacterium]|nr:hypothetical protein [Myxococcales bacterium]